jgi:type III pantothenate kinase
MPDSVLLIDMGNTRIKWIWAFDGRIDEKSYGQGSLDAFRRFTQGQAGDAPGKVLLSSVAAQERTRAITDICKSSWLVTISRLSSVRQQAGVWNAYEQADTLGVDRWLAIVGAASRYGKPVVIWDLGTATTLDAVDAEGQHLGGYIFPGPASMLEALRSGTALTVPRDLSGALNTSSSANGLENGISPGKTTADCITQGVIATQVGALRQFLNYISQQAPNPTLVVTGGAAQGLVASLNVKHVHDPWLVFRGMLTTEYQHLDSSAARNKNNQ